jgi:YaiO family outer membrane protein
MQYRRIGIIFFTICLLLPAIAFPQDSTTADGLYSMARSAAFDQKDYPAAIRYARRAVSIAPSYSDVVVFLGRLFYWSGEADSARTYFKRSMDIVPVSEDAYVAFADLEVSSQNFDEALRIIDNGMQSYSPSVPLMVRKGRVFREQKKYEKLRDVALQIVSIDRKNAEARLFLEITEKLLAGNVASLSYDLAVFDEQYSDPWHIVSVDYTRKTIAGSYTARVNFADRLNSSAVQYEVEAYPRFSKKLSGYINLGLSPGEKVVFPEWKAGASLLYSLPKGWETELGFRYLYFSSSTTFYTGYLGKYFGNYLVGLRAYIVPDDDNSSQTIGLSLRRFLSATDHLQLNVSAGQSPDEQITSAHLARRMSAYSANISYKRSLRAKSQLMLRSAWQIQEYQVAKWGNQFNVGAGFAWIF